MVARTRSVVGCSIILVGWILKRLEGIGSDRKLIAKASCIVTGDLVVKGEEGFVSACEGDREIEIRWNLKGGDEGGILGMAGNDMVFSVKGMWKGLWFFVAGGKRGSLVCECKFFSLGGEWRMS